MPTSASRNVDALLDPCLTAADPFDFWLGGREGWWRELAAAAVDRWRTRFPELGVLHAPASGADARGAGLAAPYRSLLVPTPLFKRQHLGSPSADAVACNSSGTRGSVSTVFRDDDTLYQFFSGVSACSRSVLGLRTSGWVIASLVPPVLRPDSPWTSYIVAGMATAHPSVSVSGADGVERLRKALGSNDRVVLVGAPREVLRFAQDVTAPIGADGRLTIVTVGGWKTNEGAVLSAPSLRSEVAAALGIDPTSVRDGYSMVELNTVMIECERFRKHVPPWLEVVAYAPRSFDQAGPREEGMLAFFDPTPASYPGFVLSEDVGRIDGDACPCGIPGTTLSGVRRLASVESRGCALSSVPGRSASRVAR